MEDSWMNLISEWEMDDDFFNQSHMNHCNEEQPLKDMIVQQPAFCPRSNPSSPSLQSNLQFTPFSFPTGYVLSFDKPNFQPDQNHTSKNIAQSKNTTPRARTQDHILAERKRREELTNTIIELSAIIPGLKKTDKTHVVREAVNYVKHLKERVKELENQKREECLNSRTMTKKTILSINDRVEEEHPQIKISVLDKEVLIRIVCQNPNHTLLKLWPLLHNLHLNLKHQSVLPLGASTCNVTIIAKMDDEYNMTIDELIKALEAE